jgi:hypothetical protein
MAMAMEREVLECVFELALMLRTCRGFQEATELRHGGELGRRRRRRRRRSSRRWRRRRAIRREYSDCNPRSFQCLLGGE